MQLREVEIFVFKVDNDTFELLGTVNKYSSLIWPEKFRGYGSFELWAPITEENNYLLKTGHIIWIGLSNACMIESVNSEVTVEGIKKVNVKGRSLEKIFEERILWGTYYRTNRNMSTIMYEVVDKCCINPTDINRKIPWLENADDDFLGDKISVQKTGGYVNDFLMDITAGTRLGYTIDFLPRENKLVFKVLEGKDRTRTNIEGNNPVELSTEFDDILSSEYSINSQNFRNVAFIQGEENDDGSRESTSVGALSLAGYERKEIYVDARDLQSEIFDDSGEAKKIPPEEYLQMLINRANEKLSDKNIDESFVAITRQFGLIQYEPGKDYLIGDFITVSDNVLQVRTDVQVTNIQREYAEYYDVRLTFGEERPTIIERVKKLVNNQ